MPWIDEIKLGFNNNLILGNIPKKVRMAQVANKMAHDVLKKSHICSLGLFDSNSHNYNTYYPEVTAKDLKPQKADFIEPVFRALSEVVVHRNWNPVDFSRNNTLRKSISLLKGVTINSDHETAVANAIGAVSRVFWQESYKAEKGILVPAGINAALKIDGKSNPKIARGIMMDPPSIHSTSVTVRFLWEKSHPSMSEEDFFKNLGSHDADGNLITRVATSIKSYNEISLVSHGADPFAQKINDQGVINNPVFAAQEMNSSKVAKERKKQKVFIFNFKTDILANSKKNTIPKKINTNNNNAVMKKLIAVLSLALGIKIDEKNPNVKVVKDSLRKLQKDASTSQVQLKATKAENNTLKQDKAKLEKSNTRLKVFKNNTIKQLRKEAIRNFTLISSGNPSEKTLEMLRSTDFSTLKTLNEEYLTQLNKLFPLTCKDCESTNVSRGSAVLEGSQSNTEKVKPEDLSKKIIGVQSKSAIKFMHPEEKEGK